MVCEQTNASRRMPPIGRRLFNLAAAVSLVLCVASIAMWVRSYRVWDRVRWKVTPRASVEVGTSMGKLEIDAYLAYGEDVLRDGPPLSYMPWHPHDLFATVYEDLVTNWRLLGFGLQSYRDAKHRRHLLR